MLIAELLKLREAEQKYEVGDKVKVNIGGKWWDATITKPPHKVTGNYGVRFSTGKKIVNTLASPEEIKK
jgi:hypothetical protein